MARGLRETPAEVATSLKRSAGFRESTEVSEDQTTIDGDDGSDVCAGPVNGSRRGLVEKVGRIG